MASKYPEERTFNFWTEAVRSSVIDSFAFNRGKNLANNITNALNKLNTTQENNEKLTEPNTTNVSPEASSRMKNQAAQLAQKLPPETTQRRIETQRGLKDVAEAQNVAETNVDHKSQASKENIQKQSYGSLNDLQAAMAKILNHKDPQPESEAPTTPNPTPSADTAPKAEIPTGHPGIPDDTLKTDAAEVATTTEASNTAKIATRAERTKRGTCQYACRLEGWSIVTTFQAK